LQASQEGEVAPLHSAEDPKEERESQTNENMQALQPNPQAKAFRSLIVLFKLYMVNGIFLSIVAALGIIGTTALSFCWQFTITGAGIFYVGEFTNYLWLIILIIPSSIFPLLYFLLMLRASTRMQQKGIHGIMASPLSFFTSNNPAVVLRTLLQDSQDVEFNLSLGLGMIYLLISQIVSTVSKLRSCMIHLLASEHASKEP